MEKYEEIIKSNATTRTLQPNLCLHKLIEDTVERYPDVIALKSSVISYTYKMMNERANQLARYLKVQYPKKEKIIGILVERSLESIIEMLAVLKMGNSYLPIDIDYPKQRVEYILLDSGVDVLLTGQSYELEGYTGKIINTNETYLSDISNENLNLDISSSDSAYVIYTSGTTGKPKGIIISHESICNFVLGISDEISFQQGKKFVSVTTMAFDMFQLECYVSLVNGMVIVMASKEECRGAEEFKELVRREEIQYISTTPSRIMLYLSCNHPEEIFGGFEYVILGGEPMTQKMLSGLRKVTNGEIYNLYGPTETTVYSTSRRVESIVDNNIGKPIWNTRIYILDEKKNELGVGEEGEICIAGAGVAKGYLGKKELTEEKFIAVPQVGEERVYCTGDLGKWNEDGTLELKGRIDNQVKIRGYRIEVDEIDSCLMEHFHFVDCVTVDRLDCDESKYLCSYIVAKEAIDQDEVRNYLKKRLPEYMVPSFFVELESIPLNPNGKMDRSRLPEPEKMFRSRKMEAEQHSELEEKILDIMESVIGVRGLSVEDDFFQVGGHSLKVTSFLNRLMVEVGLKLSLKELYENSTVYQIVNMYQERYEPGVKSELAQDEKSMESKGTKVDDEISMLIQNINEMDAQFQQQILQAGIEKKYPFSPLQCIDLEVNNQFAGMQLSIEHELDEDVLRKAVCMLMDTQPVLRSSYNEEGMLEYAMPLDLSIPWLDLSMYLPRDRDYIREGITKYIFKKDYDYGAILSRMIVLKDRKDKYWLLVPAHSIIFDGMSSEVIHKELFKWYNRLLKNEVIPMGEKKEMFSDYIYQIQKGPQNTSSEEIIQMFDLINYNQIASTLESGNTIEEFYIEVDIEPFKKTEPYTDMWEYTLHVVSTFFETYYQQKQVALAMFVLGRNFENATFYNTVGNYVTYIPTILDSQQQDVKEIGNRIMKQIQFASEKNVHFPAIIMNEEVQEKYGEVLGLLFSNFDSVVMLGYQNHVTEDMIGLNDLIGQWNTATVDDIGNRIIDVMCSDSIYRICFTGFSGLSEKKEEIAQFVKKELEQYFMKEYENSVE